MLDLKNEVNGKLISTVKLPGLAGQLDAILGMFDPRYSEPAEYETAVFQIGDGEVDFSEAIELERYSTEDAARVGHCRMVERMLEVTP